MNKDVIARLHSQRRYDATDLGQRSKSNQGKAISCREICKTIQKPQQIATPGSTECVPSIAIPVLYARQVEVLKDLDFP